MLLPLEKLVNEFGIGPGLVVHAGANLCQEKEYYRDFGWQQVLWIEALPWIVDEAQGLLEAFPEQQIIQGALWSESEKDLQFKIASNNSESSSVFDFKWHKAVNPHITKSGTVALKSLTLDKLLDRHFVQSKPNIALLVLDLQGAEFEALCGAKLTLDSVSAIFVEVSSIEMYKGQKLLSHIVGILDQAGFVLIEHDLSRSVWSGDALFIRKEHALKNIFVDMPKEVRFPKVNWKKWLKFVFSYLGINQKRIDFLKRTMKLFFK